MAEQERDNQPKRGRKFAIRTAVILAGALALQCALIAVVFIFFGQPNNLQADGPADDDAAMARQPVEMEVIADRFQNTRTGRSYIYDTEIYIVTEQRHQGQLEETIESKSAQIRAELTTIFRRAEPAHLQEQALSTLRRQIHDALNELLGYDEEDQPLVEDVLIPQMMRFRDDM